MNKKDLTEAGSLYKGFAKGFQATQKGGALGPDAYEKSVKKYFSGDAAVKSKDSDEKPKKSKPKDSNIRDIRNIPDMLSFKGRDGMLFTYDKDKNKWISRDGQTELSPQDGAAAYNRAKEKSKLESKDVTMKKNVKEGLADLAQKAEHDHEVQMARADLYKIAKYAIKLHDMLKSIPEEQGLEGWQQAKITKASDYISAVYHNLDYDMKFGGAGELGEGKSPHKKGTKKYKKHMAAKHASMAESNDPYKKSLAEKLSKKFK